MLHRRLAVLSFYLIVLTPVFANEGVILLHGLVRTKASMTNMEAALIKEGYIVANIDYPSRTASTDELSDAVIGPALQSESLRNCLRIHFVTHSLGGLMVRSYFNRHTDPRLGRVVMLGPPNQGSEVADRLESWWLYQKINGPAGAELGTDLHAKPNQLGPVKFELGVIAGDRSINWINSLMMPGPDDGKVSVERTKVAGMKAHLVVHTTHPYIMKNETVIRETITFLKTGTFNSGIHPPKTYPVSSTFR